MLGTALLIFVCAPGIQKYEDTGSNMVSVFVNGTQVGTVKDATQVDGMILEARRRIASENSNLVLVNSDVVLSGSTDVVGQVDDRQTIVDNIYNVFRENVMMTKQPAFEVKINEFTVNLKSIDDVIALLNAAKSEYDPDSEVNSLCMTIDSWISSIQRVKNSENFPKISHGASLKLMKKLSIIENTINAVQELLVERTNN
jgi:hypothetical protein